MGVSAQQHVLGQFVGAALFVHGNLSTVRIRPGEIARPGGGGQPNGGVIVVAVFAVRDTVGILIDDGGDRAWHFRTAGQAEGDEEAYEHEPAV